MPDEDRGEERPRETFTAAEMGILAHVYRGELYRSTIWRTRLDTTTNWSVVTLGVALSISFSSPQASPLPLVLVGILILLFLMLEARRYRYFNVWRARARWMERHLVAPILRDGDLHLDENWQKVLAEDYLRPTYHVSMAVAIGRRIRRNYFWILLIQFIAYLGKLSVHPTPLQSLQDLLDRAAIGPVAGIVVLGAGTAYVAGFGIIAWLSRRHDRQRASRRGGASGMG